MLFNVAGLPWHGEFSRAEDRGRCPRLQWFRPSAFRKATKQAALNGQSFSAHLKGDSIVGGGIAPDDQV